MPRHLGPKDFALNCLQPEWMEIGVLEEVKEAEKEEPLFTKLPNENLFVISNLIMDVATPDLNKVDEIKTIIKDVWDTRQAKLR